MDKVNPVEKSTVIYHSADYDGIFCREIAHKFLPDSKLIGWNFGDPVIPMPKEGTLYILDLSPDCLAQGIVEMDRVVWIDHHKTSIDKWSPSIKGYRIDGVAACRLTWQWFRFNPNNLPRYDKQAFFERKVSEPLSVRLAGEYDIWDKRHEWTDKFQFGLRLGEPKWDLLLQDPASPESDEEVLDMVNKGEIAQAYSQKVDSDLVKYKSFRLKWEDLDFLCLNTGRFNSLTFAALDKPETGHDALLGFMWNGKVWTVSLYHASHRKDIDLSLIAVKNGGGGHKGACGFTCDRIPFLK